MPKLGCSWNISRINHLLPFLRWHLFWRNYKIINSATHRALHFIAVTNWPKPWPGHIAIVDRPSSATFWIYWLVWHRSHLLVYKKVHYIRVRLPSNIYFILYYQFNTYFIVGKYSLFIWSLSIFNNLYLDQNLDTGYCNLYLPHNLFLMTVM